MIYYKCQHQDCNNPASHVRDIPIVGDCLCYCKDHMREDRFIEDWYPLTEQRIQQEIKADAALTSFLRNRAIKFSDSK
jgi:hypothetical protein